MIRKPIFVVPLDLGTIATGNERSSNPAVHLNRQKSIGLTWKTSGASNAWVRGQFTDSWHNADFCSVIAANAQSGTQIRVRFGATQADVDGSTAYFDSGNVAFINPAITRDDGLYHSHIEFGSVVSGGWWRIDITSHTGDFEAANLVLGQTVTPSRYYNLDFERGIKDLGSIDFSRWGVADEAEGLVFRTLAFTLAWQTEAEFEASFRPMMEQLGGRGVVYVCFDPQSNTYRQGKTYLGILDKPPYARGIRKPGTYSQDYSLLSMI